MTRVAARRRLAGLIQYPPAMYEKIRQWIDNHTKAKKKKRFEEDLEQARSREPKAEVYYPYILERIEKAKEKPRSWAAYRDLDRYVAALKGIGGSKFEPEGGRRFDYPSFRSLPKEEKEKALKELREWAEESLEKGMQQIRKETEELIEDLEKRISEFDLPEDFDPSEKTKQFKLDLEGWKYNTPKFQKVKDRELRKQIDRFRKNQAKFADKLYKKNLEEHGEEDAEEMRKGYLALIESTARAYEERLGKGFEEGMPAITVSLKELNQAGGYWNDVLAELAINETAIALVPEQIDKIIKHELRHVGQTILRRALGHQINTTVGKNEPGAGLPSRRIMDPDVRQQDARSVTTKAQQAVRRLRERGIEVRDMHDLDDFEFYTELADAVDDFKDMQEKGGWNARETQTALQFYTGVRRRNRNFNWNEVDPDKNLRKSYRDLRPQKALNLWRLKNPGKWRKAAKELIKAATQPAQAAEGSIQELWKTFLDEQYEGGSAKVSNPNPDTRDSHPEITVNYLMKQPGGVYETGRRQIRREFAQWRQQRRGPQHPQQQAPQEEAAPQQQQQEPQRQPPSEAPSLDNLAAPPPRMPSSRRATLDDLAAPPPNRRG